MRSEAVSVNGQPDAILILTLTETESVTPSTEKISWNFERIPTARPIDISRMNAETLDMELEKGYADMQA